MFIWTFTGLVAGMYLRVNCQGDFGLCVTGALSPFHITWNLSSDYFLRFLLRIWIKLTWSYLKKICRWILFMVMSLIWMTSWEHRSICHCPWNRFAVKTVRDCAPCVESTKTWKSVIALMRRGIPVYPSWKISSCPGKSKSRYRTFTKTCPG